MSIFGPICTKTLNFTPDLGLNVLGKPEFRSMFRSEKWTSSSEISIVNESCRKLFLGNIEKIIPLKHVHGLMTFFGVRPTYSKGSTLAIFA
jgi:hypothetical protein